MHVVLIDQCDGGIVLIQFFVFERLLFCNTSTNTVYTDLAYL